MASANAIHVYTVHDCNRLNRDLHVPVKAVSIQEIAVIIQGVASDPSIATVIAKASPISG